MSAQQTIVLLLLLLGVGMTTATVYLELSGGQTKCFLEEVPKDTLIMGKYHLEDMNPPQAYNAQPTPLGLTIKVTDPEGSLVLDRSTGAEGKFALTSQIGGEHKLCFATNSSRWFGPAVKVRFYLDIESGVGATDYEEIAKVEHLSALELNVRKLNDRVASIRKEQNYQRGREVTFRNTSESTNTRVAVWSAIQLATLVGLGVWQMRHLKSFFKAKKLV
eukprot:TRINITY_DN839_c0_g1_i1.p1 TRINITY_DN839_c0_g1~~TRINITY_DN839_c0_g1_i1.p1  ORF type:complete len:219 (+),score=47.65 TRINITY_DN839_c0_g1_i1:50-706(+)